MFELTLTLVGLFIFRVLYVNLSDLRIYEKAKKLYEKENEGKKYSDLDVLSDESMAYWYKVVNKKD